MTRQRIYYPIRRPVATPDPPERPHPPARDSFNDLNGAANDETDGALPSASNIQIISDLSSGGTDEGRAMMQIVHDKTPGASLAFYTADNSERDFANGIRALAAAGSKVIVDDVSYFDEPMAEFLTKKH